MNRTLLLRDDLSANLVHLTRGDTVADAKKRFNEIKMQGKLLGNSKTIRGGYKVVCLSEAPISKLAIMLANPGQSGIRYSPLGVMLNKEWVYKIGGRPVIYQSEEEFATLSEAHKYKHVRYEPGKYDFTWEREWRVHTDEIKLDLSATTMIVPTRDWVEYYKDQHAGASFAIGMIMEGMIPPPKMEYHFIVLEDLGIPFPDEYRSVT